MHCSISSPEDHTPKFVFLNHYQVTSGDERFVAYSEDGDGLIVSEKQFLDRITKPHRTTFFVTVTLF